MHTTVRQGNSALAADDKEAAVARLAEVRAMLGVLGLDPLDPQWAGETDRGEDLHGVVDTLVRMVLDQREAARGRKDWGTADAIRDQLNQSGLVIEDGPQGPAGPSAHADPTPVNEDRLCRPAPGRHTA